MYAGLGISALDVSHRQPKKARLKERPWRDDPTPKHKSTSCATVDWLNPAPSCAWVSPVKSFILVTFWIGRKDKEEWDNGSLLCWSSYPQLHSGLIPVFHYPILAVTIVTQQMTVHNSIGFYLQPTHWVGFCYEPNPMVFEETQFRFL